MKELFLRTKGMIGFHYKKFEYDKIEDIKDELDIRNIKIGVNFYPVRSVMISSDVTIGDNVLIGDFTEIEYGVNIGNNVQVGMRSVICFNSTIMQNANIGIGVVISPFVKIGANSIIEGGSKLGHSSVIEPHCLLKRHSFVGEDGLIKEGTCSKTILISGTKDFINYWGEDKIKIGNDCHPIRDWEYKLDWYMQAEKYTEEQKKEYKSYFEAIKLIHSNAENLIYAK